MVPAGCVADVFAGRVGSTTAEAAGTWQSRISFHIDSAGNTLRQLLNVIFGNASILPRVKVIGPELNADIRVRFPEPRFGVRGLRKLTGRDHGGFVCPLIKPQGSSATELAKLCYLTARAGADIIKADHGLANQDAAPFRQRVRQCAAAVQQANEERRKPGFRCGPDR